VQEDIKCTDASGLRTKSWRIRLHWIYCQNNTTVWTDSRKEVKNHPPYYLWQWLHWTWFDWRVVSQQLPTVWPSKIVLFHADSLARHLLQLAYDSGVGTLDQTYLLWDEIGEMLKVSINSNYVNNYLYNSFWHILFQNINSHYEYLSHTLYINKCSIMWF